MKIFTQSQPESYNRLALLTPFLFCILAILLFSHQVIAQHTLKASDIDIFDGRIDTCYTNSEDWGSESLIIPEKINGQIVLSIGENAFLDKGIQHLQLPSGLISIEERAFSFNYLLSVDFSKCTDLKTIGAFAFEGNDLYGKGFSLKNCTKLEFVELCAFPGNIKLPKKEKNIKWYSPSTGFVKANKQLIAEDEFIALNTEKWYTLQDSDVMVFNSRITKCFSTALDWGTGNIIIPETLHNEKITGFSNPNADGKSSTNFIFQNKYIVQAKLPTTLESIAYAFGVDNILQDLYIPLNSPHKEKLEEEALFECWTKNVHLYEGEILPLEYYVLNEKDVKIENGIITECLTSISNWKTNNIAIPEEINKQAVVEIASEVFKNKEIKFLKLPKSLAKIGFQSFLGNDLQSVDFSSCENLHTIGESAFEYNPGMKFDLSNCKKLRYIANCAFHGATDYFNLPDTKSRKSCNWFAGWDGPYKDGDKVHSENSYFLLDTKKWYTLQDSDIEIENGIIIKCYHNGAEWGTGNIIIPEMLQGQKVIGIKDAVRGENYDGEGVFESKLIRKLVLPQTIEKIGIQAFGRNPLQEVNFRELINLHTIGEWAFLHIELKKIILPKSATNVDKDAFSSPDVDSIEHVE
jgi:hypothetical protein